MKTKIFTLIAVSIFLTACNTTPSPSVSTTVNTPDTQNVNLEKQATPEVKIEKVSRTFTAKELEDLRGATQTGMEAEAKKLSGSDVTMIVDSEKVANATETDICRPDAPDKEKTLCAQLKADNEIIVKVSQNGDKGLCANIRTTTLKTLCDGL
jgi:hypothetical protein